MTVKTLYIIEGCHPSHRFAEILDGMFGDRAARVCVGCLVQETNVVAESPCPLVEGMSK
jgi:hypothetical protein